MAAPLPQNWLEVTGTVTKIDGTEFTLDTGLRQFRVDTFNMPYNTMDDFGFQKISVGDRVVATGPIDLDIFEAREIMAHTVITLSKDKTKAQDQPKQQT